MSFGLRTALAAFQYKSRFDWTWADDMAIYMNDILIATEMLEYHLEIVKQVFKILSENHLKLRIIIGVSTNIISYKRK